MSEIRRYICDAATNVDTLPAQTVVNVKVVLASDYDALAEKLSIMVECADNYSRMFEEASHELAKARGALLTCAKASSAAEVGLIVDEWLERNQ